MAWDTMRFNKGLAPVPLALGMQSSPTPYMGIDKKDLSETDITKG